MCFEELNINAWDFHFHTLSQHLIISTFCSSSVETIPKRMASVEPSANQPPAESSGHQLQAESSEHQPEPERDADGDVKMDDHKYTSEQRETVTAVLNCHKKDYYGILGVEESCDSGDIKRAYKKRSLLTHPDKTKHKGAANAFKSTYIIFSSYLLFTVFPIVSANHVS